MSSVADVGRVRPHLRQSKHQLPCEHLFNIKPPQQYIQGHSGSVSRKPPAPVREFMCMNITQISLYIIDLKFWHGPSFHRNPPHQDEAKPADQERSLAWEETPKPTCPRSQASRGEQHHPPSPGFASKERRYLVSLVIIYHLFFVFFVFDNFNETCVKSAVGILSASSDPQSSWGVDTCQKNLIKTLCICNL